MNNAKIEGNNRMGKARDHFKKTGDIKGTLHAKMGTIKERNVKNLPEAEEIKERWKEYTKKCTKKNLITQIIMMVSSLS